MLSSPKIAPLQHEIELNHLDTICNWLKMSEKRGNIINNLRENHLFCFGLFGDNVDEVIFLLCCGCLAHDAFCCSLLEDTTWDVKCKVSTLQDIYLLAISISCRRVPMSLVPTGQAIQMGVPLSCSKSVPLITKPLNGRSVSDYPLHSVWLSFKSIQWIIKVAGWGKCQMKFIEGNHIPQGRRWCSSSCSLLLRYLLAKIGNSHFSQIVFFNEYQLQTCIILTIRRCTSTASVIDLLKSSPTPSHPTISRRFTITHNTSGP